MVAMMGCILAKDCFGRRTSSLAMTGAKQSFQNREGIISRSRSATKMKIFPDLCRESNPREYEQMLPLPGNRDQRDTARFTCQTVLQN
jgi:hypothetical protein